MSFDNTRRPDLSVGAVAGGAGAGAAGPGKRTLVEQLSAGTDPPAKGLRSQRFAGDATLEACFADRARLGVGAHGDPVVKVQQALVDLGFNVGPRGVDGDYGPATSEAVKLFKAREKLGFETMGDVGPGTMHRLDEIFSTGPTPPTPTPDDGRERATDGGQASAQDFVITSDDDSVAGLDALGPIPDGLDEGALTAAFLARPERDVELGVAGPLQTQLSGAGHVSIPDAVARFKSKIDVTNPAEPGTNIDEKGQFFWGRQLGLQVKAEIDALRSVAGATDFCDKAEAAWQGVMAFQDAGAEIATAQRAAATSRSPAKKRMLALIHGFVTGGAELEATMWKALDKQTSNDMPDLSQFRSVVTLRTVRKFDKVACTVHMLRSAERIKKKGGITARSSGAKGFFATLNTGSGFRDRRPVDSARRHLGDVVNQTGVSSAVAGLQTALDAGLLVHARLLSGVGLGSVPVPAEDAARRLPIEMPIAGEHSVLIIGFDGNRFVFNDPDAAESRSPEPGFGILQFADGHLTTATSASDLLVDAGGNHAGGQHRYQVLFLASV